jgi:pimeloyl-ACP methyl ester carboxylesterase
MAFVESNGVRIFYDVIERTAPWITEPETIIFNHGIGIDHRMWTKWIPALVDRYRIVLFDMRGFGQSSIPAAAGWSMDLLVDDVFAIAGALGVSRFHLAGESMGGTIALCAYFRNPRALRTITVSNGSHIGATLENLNDWRDVIAASGMGGWSNMMSERRFYDDGLPPNERAWFDAAQAACSADSCMNALGVLRGSDLTPRLKEIAVPVLLLHGDASPFIPLTITSALHAGLPDSEVRVFPHAKHGLPLSHGTQCGEEMRAFLDRRRGI